MNNFTDNTYKRVEQIIVYNNMNIKSFEDRISVSNNSIGTAIRRKASFKSNVLNKILNAFPEINPTWLLTGKGTMFLNSDNTIVNEPTLNYETNKFKRQLKENLLHLLNNDKDIKQALMILSKTTRE